MQKKITLLGSIIYSRTLLKAHRHKLPDYGWIKKVINLDGNDDRVPDILSLSIDDSECEHRGLSCSIESLVFQDENNQVGPLLIDFIIEERDLIELRATIDSYFMAKKMSLIEFEAE